MKVLVAEDTRAYRKLLEMLLERWGYEIVSCADGVEAFKHLSSKDGPGLAVLDWSMPKMDGIEVCRRIRSFRKDRYIYMILLTSRDKKKDLVEGLEAGADDYITKPFDEHELRSRVLAGKRIVQLEIELAGKVRELQEALEHVTQLQGLLPICMHCGKVRDHQKIWYKLESYVEKFSTAKFSHSLCEDCLAKFYPEEVGEGSG